MYGKRYRSPAPKHDELSSGLSSGTKKGRSLDGITPSAGATDALTAQQSSSSSEGAFWDDVCKDAGESGHEEAVREDAPSVKPHAGLDTALQDGSQLSVPVAIAPKLSSSSASAAALPFTSPPVGDAAVQSSDILPRSALAFKTPGKTGLQSGDIRACFGSSMPSATSRFKVSTGRDALKELPGAKGRLAVAGSIPCFLQTPAKDSDEHAHSSSSSSSVSPALSDTTLLASPAALQLAASPEQAASVTGAPPGGAAGGQEGGGGGGEAPRLPPYTASPCPTSAADYSWMFAAGDTEDSTASAGGLAASGGQDSLLEEEEEQEQQQQHPKLQQSYLDFGQRALEHVRCPSCSMIYSPAVAEDAREHARFCKRKGAAAAITFPGWKSETVVWRSSESSSAFQSSTAVGVALAAPSSALPSLHNGTLLSLWAAAGRKGKEETEKAEGGAGGPFLASASDAVAGTSASPAEGMMACAAEGGGARAAVMAQPIEKEGVALQELSAKPLQYAPMQRPQRQLRHGEEAPPPLPADCRILSVEAQLLPGSTSRCRGTLHAGLAGNGRPQSSSSASKPCGKLQEIREHLCSILGSSSDPLAYSSSCSNSSSRSGGSEAEERCRGGEGQPVKVCYWLCISSGQVVGVLVTEHIASAYRLVIKRQSEQGKAECQADSDSDSDRRASASAAAASAAPGETAAMPPALSAAARSTVKVGPSTSPPLPLGPADGEELLCLQEDKREAAQLGVAQIWVREDFRRMGLAVQLLDCARDNALYGMSLPVAQLAFSQPTRAGRALAAAYTGRPDFLVY